MIPQKEIDEANQKNYDQSKDCFGSKEAALVFGFQAGFKFAESKFEEIAIEFGEWLDTKRQELKNMDNWFEQFIKERNEKS